MSHLLLRWTTALLVAFAALPGCASSPSDDAAEGAAAVSTATDADAWGAELSDRLDGAVLELTRDIRFGAGQTFSMVGFARETMCELERTGGTGTELTLTAGARYVLGDVAARHGGMSSSTKDLEGIGGTLAASPAGEGTARLALRCFATDAGARPTVEGIAAAFATRSGKQITLTLATTRP